MAVRSEWSQVWPVQTTCEWHSCCTLGARSENTHLLQLLAVTEQRSEEKRGVAVNWVEECACLILCPPPHPVLHAVLMNLITRPMFCPTTALFVDLYDVISDYLHGCIILPPQRGPSNHVRTAHCESVLCVSDQMPVVSGTAINNEQQA